VSEGRAGLQTRDLTLFHTGNSSTAGIVRVKQGKSS